MEVYQPPQQAVDHFVGVEGTEVNVGVRCLEEVDRGEDNRVTEEFKEGEAVVVSFFKHPSCLWLLSIFLANLYLLIHTKRLIQNLKRMSLLI